MRPIRCTVLCLSIYGIRRSIPCVHDGRFSKWHCAENIGTCWVFSKHPVPVSIQILQFKLYFNKINSLIIHVPRTNRGWGRESNAPVGQRSCPWFCRLGWAPILRRPHLPIQEYGPRPKGPLFCYSGLLGRRAPSIYHQRDECDQIQVHLLHSVELLFPEVGSVSNRNIKPNSTKP